MIIPMNMKQFCKFTRFSDESPTLTFKGAIFGRHHEEDHWRPVHTQDSGIVHSRRLECGVDKEYDVSRGE